MEATTASTTQLLFPQTTIDPRLPVKENVLGIRHGAVSRAYSMSRLSSVASRHAINDVVDRLPVLVVFDGPSALAVPFERRTSGGMEGDDGEVLTFTLADDSGFPFHGRDQQTGSRWNLDGVAVSGPLEGDRLRKSPTFTSFWFAWSSFNPGAEIYSLVSQ